MDKATILFADNDPDFLATRSEFLEQAGYTVIPARNPAQAQRKLEDGGIDLAILDIRLTDDDDERDFSGLALAKEVARSVPKVILTGFPSVDAAREALRPQLDGLPAAVEFLSKEEGVGEMLRAVRTALAAPSAGADTKAPRRSRRAGMQWASGVVGLVALLLALGAGVLATMTGDPRWLFAAVFLAVLVVLGVGLAVFMPW